MLTRTRCRRANGATALEDTAPVSQPTEEPPGKVRGAKAKVRNRKMKITWETVARADSYLGRTSKPGGKKHKKWKTTSMRVFKAEVRKGKKYRFQVAAVGVGGRGPTTTIRFKVR